MRATHSQRLERWLGAEAVEGLSRSMQDWYGPPIGLHGVPGRVYAHGGGDFSGEIEAGFFASCFDRGRDLARRLQRAARIASGPRRAVLHAGFAGLSDFQSNAKYGNRQEFQFSTVGISVGVAGGCYAAWANSAATNIPPTTNIAASAAPGGRTPVAGTDGGFFNRNAASGDTLHFAGGMALSNDAVGVQGGQILIYDRIFDVAKTMSSTGTEAVTGVPTRYTNTTRLAADDIAGNFAFVEVVTGFGAGAHNWTVCTYKDENNSASTFPSMAGNASQTQARFDHPAYKWFIPLEAGDIGVKAITQMQCDASITGAANFVIGHPIAWMPVPYAAMVCDVGGIVSALNFARVFDNACLSWLSICQATSAARTFSGTFTLVSG